SSPAAGSSSSSSSGSVNRRSLRAAALPDRYVRQHSGLASLADVTAGSAGEVRQAATFTVVAGLADASCFSFAGADGNYLRHRDYRIRHERHDGSQLFRADATFCIRQGGLPGSIYLESYNYRDHYVHLRGDELWIDRWRDGGEFRQECSFAVTAAWS
ncbi:AbfB domain-containing protein, partial [Catellatospora sp. NPDC049609]|uniref:AbfB domain-containing protein n=1 Tax=Catellatospora sp. NPDC049609 TaxID=3155505 RepID=UPI0034156C90